MKNTVKHMTKSKGKASLKRIFTVALAVIMLSTSALALVSCGGNGKPTVGIIQFGSHGSLNNCYDGIMAGLAENGITEENCNIRLANSNFDPSLSQTQANSFVNSAVDVIIAIATPSAVAAATASDGDIPVVFCAVTDSSTMANYENITGSSDIPSFDRQLEVVTAFMGKSDLKIGVLFSTEESSSPVQVSALRTAAEKYDGMEILDSAVADINTIDTKVNELISRGVDCFVNLLDNTVVGKLESNILPITNEKKIPVFGLEIEQVKVGCVASASIEYLTVGRAAGKAAADILGGESADNIPIATITQPNNYYNSAACALLGLAVPAVTAEDVCE